MKGHIHFRHQRVSAYILFALLSSSIFFPFGVFLQGLTLLFALYHSFLGLIMVIEDYTQYGRSTLIFITQFITILLMGIVVWSMLTRII